MESMSDVVGDGQGQLRAVVAGAEILDVVAVLLHVVGVRDLRPGRRVDVDVATGQARVERGGVGDLLELDVDALVLEHVLPQVGHAQAVGPGRDEAEGDRLAAAAAAGRVAVAAVVVAAAGGGRQGDGGQTGCRPDAAAPRAGSSVFLSSVGSRRRGPSGVAGPIGGRNGFRSAPCRSDAGAGRGPARGGGVLVDGSAGGRRVRRRMSRERDLPSTGRSRRRRSAGPGRWPGSPRTARRRSRGRCSAGRCCVTTIWPRPGAPTKPAMTAIESASMITWLTPAMIVGRASGSSMPRRICHGERRTRARPRRSPGPPGGCPAR